MDAYGQELDSSEPNDSDVEWVLPVFESEVAKHKCKSDPYHPRMCRVCKENRHNPEAYHGDEVFWTKTLSYLNSKSLVIDVGGYVGDTLENLFRLYNPVVHTFEPMSAAYNTLMAREDLNRSGQFFPHKVALGFDYSNASYVDLKGDGAMLHDEPGPDRERVDVINASDAVQMLARVHRRDIALLHVNCEVCEWSVLESLLPSLPLVQHVAIQWHGNAPVPRRMERWCSIHAGIQQTHFLDYGANWIWEHWRRRDLL